MTVPKYRKDLRFCRSLESRQWTDSTAALKVGMEITRTYERHKLGKRDIKKRNSIVQSLQAKVESAWPGQGLELLQFGSSVTGLATKASDIDIVIRDPSRPYGRWTSPQNIRPLRGGLQPTYKEGSDWLPAWYDVEALADVLLGSRFVEAKEAVHAVVPFVRLTLTSGLGSVDVIVNNSFSDHTSRLVAAYQSLRPITLPRLFFGVKFWLRNRGLNDSSARSTGLRTLSSYAIALLVIQFLQSHWNLPNLQDKVLLERVPRDPKYTERRDGYEPPRKTGRADAPSSKAICSWNITYVSPRGKHAGDVDVVEQDGVACIAEPGWLADNRHPHRLSSWMLNYASIRKQPMWRNLPHPDHVGLHRVEGNTVEEVGRLFLDFVRWLQAILDSNAGGIEDVIDISFGGVRGLRTDDPIAWQNREFVIVDPFIKHRNVASAITGTALALLRFEVARADRFVREYGDETQWIELSRPRRKIW